MDYSMKIGGEAGQGIVTVGDTLAKVFSRAGYHVFTHQDYESRIRGGHNFFQIRLSDAPVAASREGIDILVAFDKESISLHARELTDIGVVIYDSSLLGEIQTLNSELRTLNCLDIPFVTLATDHGGNKIMANTVAIGAVLGMLGISLEILFEIIKDTFFKKGDEVIKGNINAATAGKEFAEKNCKMCSFSVGAIHESPLKPKMMINGVEGIALGAIASGCKFYSAYPMTPSTGIMNYIAGKEKEHGIVMEQAEDEIAAINMALGASFAGVRAMTGTAGGGFALMVEGLSLAAMTETPVVIALGQRPAPATGLPTRTEQGDLSFALYTAHGEFPRIVFAPGTPEQAFYLTSKAFDLAEKYQIPAIVIFDQYLADTQWTHDGFDLSKVRYMDYRLRGKALKNMPGYKRHVYTESGVSPLAVPGDSRHLVVTDSDEHDEDGHLIEDAETRVRMVDKRLFKKLPLISAEIEPPVLYGSSKPEIVIVGWGSNYGLMKEAVDALSKEKSIAMLHFSEIYPFPSTNKFDYLSLLKNAKTAICIENNATGQFARLMRAETGYEFKHNINRYDGRPFLLEELVEKIKGEIQNNPSWPPLTLRGGLNPPSINNPPQSPLNLRGDERGVRGRYEEMECKMPTIEDYKGRNPAWCPGCGDFGILRAFKEAVVEMGLEPHQFTIVSGIGQAGKFPHYLKCNTFNGLHGRTLPVATGIRLSNHDMRVIAVAGDGDCYGEGGNHLTHAIRRNVNIKPSCMTTRYTALQRVRRRPHQWRGWSQRPSPSGCSQSS